MIQLPGLSVFDREHLKQSIEANGVLEPIVLAYDDPEGLAPDGERIDGDHRQQICAELGIECPSRIIRGLTRGQRDIYALHINAARRHMDVEERRHLWRAYRVLISERLKLNPERSNREIARELGADDHTVAKERAALEASADIRTTEYKPSHGGGARLEKEPQAENFADHRNELYFEFTLHYPSPSDEIRKRGDDPFPKASVRKDWSTGTLYLTCEAPENTTQAAAMLSEAFQRVSREMSQRPLKTMVRALV